jgi:hypothetical protein
MNLSTATFTISENLVVEGYYDPEVRWNGFYCPYFTREAVTAWLAASLLEGSIEGYTVTDDMVFVQQNGVAADEADEYEFEQVDGMELCMLGGYSWIWDIVTE